MKITYNNTTINFFDFEPMPAQVLITLSGGLDSAALMYLIGKHFPEIEIIPFTARDPSYPRDAAAVSNVSDWLKKHLVEANIHDLKIYDIDQEDRTLVTEQQIQQAKIQKPGWKDLPDSGISKTLQLNAVCQTVKNQYPDAVRCDGMTGNPPADVMKQLGFYEQAERRRDISEKRDQKANERLYRPFVNVDKKFVADIYFQNDLMHSLFPLTKSCVGKPEHTDNFTRDCGICFWCHEKKWAFGL